MTQGDDNTYGAPAVVPRRAVIRRLNERLAPLGQRVRTTRGSWSPDLGDHWVQDLRHHFVAETHIDVAQWAREHGALGPGEVCGD